MTLDDAYKAAGVDIDAGNALVETIKPFIQRTRRPEVLTGLGGFSGLFELPIDRYKAPVLVSGTDGVGTKLKLALALEQHDTIGIDLVAMCVNDVIVCGAEPLFFLDYYATGQLNTQQASQVIKGIANGCEQAGAALIGGETAEMPGMYDGDYDLAGFCVGIVEKADLIDSSRVTPGDTLIALASSGPHANGYSLIRKILRDTQTDLQTLIDGQTLGQLLLTPTRIYAHTALHLQQEHSIHAFAHITGGGIIENLPRVLPAHCQAIIDTHSWTPPSLFAWLQEAGQLSQTNMRRTFNCGVGFIAIVPEAQAQSCLAQLTSLGEVAWVIGHVTERTPDTPAVVFNNE